MKINPLTPKWQHDDPSVRLQSVLGGKLSPEILVQLAQLDEDESVRGAAIELIEDTNSLLNLATGGTIASQLSAKRWATLVGADLQHLEVVTSELPSLLITALAMHAPSEDFRIRATDQLSDDEQLLAILLNENLSRVHQHCATKVGQEEHLISLQQHFTSRDKNVTRILKSKLQVIRQSRSEQLSNQETLQTLQNKLIALKTAELTPEFSRRVDALKHQWLENSKLVEAEPFSPIIQNLIAECEALVANIPDPQEILRAQLVQLIDRCNRLNEECLKAPSDVRLADALANIVKDWPAEATDQMERHTAELTQLVNAQRRWQGLLNQRKKLNLDSFKQSLADLDWPESFPKPTDFSDVTNKIELVLTEKAETQAIQLAKQLEVQQLMEKFETEVSAGHIKAANRVSSKLTSALENFRPGGEQSNHIQQLMAKLQELKDWQGFATQPKRDELCQKMKALADETGIPPQEKAKAIKELQDEWKKLGSSDSRQAQKSWSRFKTYGDAAFAPCAKFYAEQEKIRQDNLLQRETICSSLEEIESKNDWSNVDWKSIGELINRAKQEWRQYSNVPRSASKAIDRRFDKALKPIQTRIDLEQSNNADKKNELIKDLAESLEQNVPIEELVAKAKSAQQNWKSIGITHHRQDQKLWKAFRTNCDAVFAKRDEEKNAAKTAANAQVTEYRNHCKAFQSQLESDNAITKKDIAEFRKTLATIQLDKSHRSLQNESTSLIKNAEKLIKQQVAANQVQMMSEYQHRCLLSDQLEAGQITREEFEAKSNLDVIFDQRFNLALENRKERSNDEQELLVIRLELLADLSSPETSQPMRMAFQVERLNKELSRGEKETRSEKEQLEELFLEWFGTKNKSSQFDHRIAQISTKLGLAV